MAYTSASKSRAGRPRNSSEQAAPTQTCEHLARDVLRRRSKADRTSLSNSAVTPPNPATMTGPKEWSLRAPTIISTPETISWTRNPSTVAVGWTLLSCLSIAWAGFRPDAASFRSSATPPTSVLWLASRRNNLERHRITDALAATRKLRRRFSPALPSEAAIP